MANQLTNEEKKKLIYRYVNTFNLETFNNVRYAQAILLTLQTNVVMTDQLLNRLIGLKKETEITNSTYYNLAAFKFEVNQFNIKINCIVEELENIEKVILEESRNAKLLEESKDAKKQEK